MPLDFASSALVTLLVTVDPIGLAPLFLALTGGMNRSQSRRLGITASIIAFFVLVAFAVAGGFVLRQLGIGLPAFRIAGGLLLFKTAFEMVFGQRTDRKEATEGAITPDHIRNLAAFPLAVPLMAGPGAITATLLLADQTRGDLTEMALLIAIIAAVIGSCVAVYIAAHEISDLIGNVGRVVLTRLLGVILSALAVQFVINGVLGIWPAH